jgi:uncharacterized repeat protein (TIGR03803 family)
MRAVLMITALTTYAFAHARAAPLHSVIFSFSQHNGAGPVGGLIVDRAGRLFGVTQAGGAFGKGTVFRLIPPEPGHTAWTETVLYSFGTTTNDGASPAGGLVRDKAGNLYGTTAAGGASLFGTVFKLAPPTSSSRYWSETILHNFGATNQDGSDPVGSLAVGANGNIYGLTFEGGSANKGTVFEMAPPASAGANWAERVVHTFGGADGSAPVGGLAAADDGRLFGVTSEGGASGNGTVFEMRPANGNWAHTTLLSFSYAAGTGVSPLDGVSIGAAGTLFGTTNAGGPDGTGTVFEMRQTAANQWTHKLLFSFAQSAESGAFPGAAVVVSNHGDAYGTTQTGGKFGQGTLFQLSPGAAPNASWTQKVLRVFGSRATSNPGPYARLALDAGGNLYGTTYAGGSRGYGTVFRIAP